MTEKEIQNYILSDANNEIINLYENIKEPFNMHYRIRVVLNSTIDPMFHLQKYVYQILLKQIKILNFL